jgi:putative DNA primase/helicase
MKKLGKAAKAAGTPPKVDAKYPVSTQGRPCFRLYPDVWSKGGGMLQAGVYRHSYTITVDNKIKLKDERICAPLEVQAITSTREDSEYGRLVEFTSQNGRVKRYSISARHFANRGDEALGELLALGLEIVRKHRARVLDYIASVQPEKRYAAALSTGWYNGGHAFVLPNEVIGAEGVWYQGKDEQNPYTKAGKFEDWQACVAAFACGNPNLMVALCGSLAGPLFKLLGVSGGGMHWFGPTTIGKTTVLEVSQSTWGGPHFRRTWEATLVGLQAMATLHTDTLMVLDEIHAVDPKVLDSTIYALINGHGKSRGTIHASSRPAARWRVLVLSSGELSSETQLATGGFTVRAGQTIRILDIPVEGNFGAFDSLHGARSGAEFADTLKGNAAQHYGHAGPLFVSALIQANKEEGLNLQDELAGIQKGFQPTNEPQRRVTRTFAILALAGELGVRWKLLPWEPGEATAACKLLFNRWQEHVPVNAAPEQKILGIIADFIAEFGDSKFSNLYPGDNERVPIERVGYWMEIDAKSEVENPKPRQFISDPPVETRRIYLFSSVGLKKATKGYDLNQVLKALKAADAFYKTGLDAYAKVTRTPSGTQRLYHIDPSRLG